MVRSHRILIALLGVVLAASALHAQPRRELSPIDETLRMGDSPGLPEQPKLMPRKDLPPNSPDRVPSELPPTWVENQQPPKNAPQWIFLPRLDLTYVPEWGGNRKAEFTDVELLTNIQIPLGADVAPLRITPYLAGRFWKGPDTIRNGPGIPPAGEVPGALYDAWVDITWRPRLAEWLYTEFRLSPGYFTDGHNTTSDGFLPRGYIVSLIALSEQFQFVLGGVWTNRVRTTVVPAGGIRYVPDEDTEYLLVLPAPRNAKCVDQIGDTKYWLHLSGEFGGGAWAVRRDNGLNDTLDYSDFRIMLGMEARTPRGLIWHAEIGYVFERILSYKSDRPETSRLSDSVMLRVGFSY